MQNPLSYYAMLARRWAWLIVLGVIICGGGTYVISKLTPPVYEAKALLNINLNSAQSPYDNFSTDELAATTYAQLLANPELLKPILMEHQGLTQQQLVAMINAKPIANTSLIELDVDNSNPALAAQLANDICKNFGDYANTQLLGPVQIVPAGIPVIPIKPKPLTYAGIGALIGFGLALALIVIFEWVDDRLTRPEEVQELLGMDTLAIIPLLSDRKSIKKAKEIPVLAEEYRMLCISLNAARTIKPFKLVMITSALPGEGKSNVAANLASFLSMTGKHVLLVNADLRHPTLDQHFQLDNREGLSNTLLDMWVQEKAGSYGQETEIPMLRVLTIGTPSSNSTELLQSPLIDQFFDHLKKAPFDYIIFDTSPLLPVADAQILAAHVQATVLVIDVSKTSRSDLRQVRQVLNRTHTLKLGVVINKSRWPDYGKSREYLSYIRAPRKEAAIATTPPRIPPTNDTHVTIPDTSATKEVEDPNITVTIRNRQSVKDELR